MPIAAAYKNATTFTAAYDADGQKDLRNQCAVGVRIRANCGPDGYRYGVVTAVSYADPVTTIQMSGDALTANMASFDHGNDIPASLVNHGHTGPADGGGLFASTSETQAGALATKGVTPAGLAASAKGLISANTTIYVAATGNDTTGTGLAGAPYATIAKALASIANKLIASGVVVTIQVADGTYNISQAITIDHPDADKIQILGNTAVETTVAIVSIDAAAKTITVGGDRTTILLVGDLIGLTGSSTSGLNGAYLVSGVSYNGTNTVITCSTETFASATVGGGSIVIKPCNRCALSFTYAHCFDFQKSLGLLRGFKIVQSTPFSGSKCLNCSASATVSVKNLILYNQYFGLILYYGAIFYAENLLIKNSTDAIKCDMGARLYVPAQTTIIDNASEFACVAAAGAYVRLPSACMVYRNAPDISPAVNGFGNSVAYISTN